MKVFNEVLMILCYMWTGVWVQRSTDYFISGNTEGGWWTLLATIVFAVLGAINLAFVKQDAKKEEK